MRDVKQACSDTIEESISSTEEVALHRKRARVYKGLPASSTTHITFNTSFHRHITISPSNSSTSHRTILHECGTVSWSVLNSLCSKQTKQTSAVSSFDLLTPALLNTREYGGYTGTRVGEEHIQDLPHTPETGRKQSSPTPLRDGSTKLATQFRAARTP